MLPNVVGSVPVSLPSYHVMTLLIKLFCVMCILIFAFHAPRAPTVRRKGSENVALFGKRKGQVEQADLKILLSLGQVLSLVGPTFQVSNVKTAGLCEHFDGGSSSAARPPRLSLPAFTARAIASVM